MASYSKQNPGLIDLDSEIVPPDTGGVYNAPVAPAPGPSPASPSYAPTSASSAASETDAGAAAAPSSSAPAPATDYGTPPSVPLAQAAVGTSHADVFPLDTATLNAAVAPTPQLAQITGYTASQGDVIDFSAILRGSYAPLTPEATQLRVNTSGPSATLDFNVGTADHPHWAALAQLDGIHAGDTVNVALDATHTVHLLAAAWLV